MTRMTAVIPATSDWQAVVNLQSRYIFEHFSNVMDVMVVAPQDGEPFFEPICRNAATVQVTTDYVVQMCAGVYPTESVVYSTLAELDRDPSCVVVAMRIDETADGGARNNDCALGDWVAMRTDTYHAIGGYDEKLVSRGYWEFDVLARAIMDGRRVVLLDGRLWHKYHPVCDADEYRRLNMSNVQLSVDQGRPYFRFVYPELMVLEGEDTMYLAPIERQAGSILPPIPRPRDVWRFVERDVPTHPGTFRGLPDIVLERYKPALEYAAGKTVLDFGCGCGHGSYLLSRVAKKVVGFDTSQYATKWANAYKSPNLSFTNELPDEQFDCVVSVECLEHVTEDDARRSMLPAMAARCSDLLYLTTPIREHEGPQRMQWHLKVYSESELEDLLRGWWLTIERLPTLYENGHPTQVVIGRKGGTS